VIFYGSKFNFTPEQSLNTLAGDFYSLLNCEAIYNGSAKVKEKKKGFFETLLID
jgi:hypothetical protein